MPERASWSDDDRLGGRVATTRVLTVRTCLERRGCTAAVAMYVCNRETYEPLAASF
jgi:hypothetical protein